MYLRFFFEEMSDLQLFAKKPIKAVNDLKNIKLTAVRKVFEQDCIFRSYPDTDSGITRTVIPR